MADALLVSITEDDGFAEEGPLRGGLKVLAVERVFGLIALLNTVITEMLRADYEAVSVIVGGVCGIPHSGMAVAIAAICKGPQMRGVDSAHCGIMTFLVLNNELKQVCKNKDD